MKKDSITAPSVTTILVCSTAMAIAYYLKYNWVGDLFTFYLVYDFTEWRIYTVVKDAIEDSKEG